MLLAAGFTERPTAFVSRGSLSEGMKKIQVGSWLSCHPEAENFLKADSRPQVWKHRSWLGRQNVTEENRFWLQQVFADPVFSARHGLSLFAGWKHPPTELCFQPLVFRIGLPGLEHTVSPGSLTPSILFPLSP